MLRAVDLIAAGCLRLLGESPLASSAGSAQKLKSKLRISISLCPLEQNALATLALFVGKPKSRRFVSGHGFARRNRGSSDPSADAFRKMPRQCAFLRTIPGSHGKSGAMSIRSVSARLEGFPAMAVAGLQIAIVFALSTLPTPLYGDYRKIYGYQDIAASLVYGAYAAGTITSLLFLGRLSDQIGRRRAALPALGIAAIAALLFLPADHSQFSLYLARAATGLAVGMSTGAAVAWMPELDPDHDKRRAALISVAFNIFGLGLGPVLAGVSADVAPKPLQLCFEIYLLSLIPLALAVAVTGETVRDRKPLAQVSFMPKLGVEGGKIMAFLSPAISNFVLFSLVGFYSAITPSMLAKTLHLPSHMLCGLIVGGLFAVGVLTVLAATRLKPKPAMFAGAFMMLPTCAFLALAQVQSSLTALLAGTVAGGIAFGLGYRGSMEVANSLAGEKQRAAVMAAYLLSGNLGTVLPVIGVGTVTQLAGAGVAVPAFAGFVAALSLLALGFGFLARDQSPAQS